MRVQAANWAKETMEDPRDLERDENVVPLRSLKLGYLAEREGFGHLRFTPAL
jgi:hypothetical protein